MNWPGKGIFGHRSCKFYRGSIRRSQVWWSSGRLWCVIYSLSNTSWHRIHIRQVSWGALYMQSNLFDHHATHSKVYHFSSQVQILHLTGRTQKPFRRHGLSWLASSFDVDHEPSVCTLSESLGKFHWRGPEQVEPIDHQMHWNLISWWSWWISMLLDPLPLIFNNNITFLFKMG